MCLLATLGERDATNKRDEDADGAGERRGSPRPLHPLVRDRGLDRRVRTSSMVRPASRPIPPLVLAWMGCCRGLVRRHTPFDLTSGVPCWTLRPPACSSARTACY